MFRFAVLTIVLAYIAPSPVQAAAPAKPRQRVDGCNWKADRWSDGDSFHVVTGDGAREIVARLYFVDTPVTIHDADGDITVRINQQEEPAHERLFRALGTFRFEAGRAGRVRVSNDGTDTSKRWTSRLHSAREAPQCGVLLVSLHALAGDAGVKAVEELAAG